MSQRIQASRPEKRVDTAPTQKPPEIGQMASKRPVPSPKPAETWPRHPEGIFQGALEVRAAVLPELLVQPALRCPPLRVRHGHQRCSVARRDARVEEDDRGEVL